jgi:hypothetical protein
MTLVFRPLGRDNLADVIARDGAFTIAAELMPSPRDGSISYEVPPVLACRQTETTLARIYAVRSPSG